MNTHCTQARENLVRYLDGEMAARSEIDCFITLDGEVVVAGEEQMELIRIHAD